MTKIIESLNLGLIVLTRINPEDPQFRVSKVRKAFQTNWLSNKAANKRLIPNKK